MSRKIIIPVVTKLRAGRTGVRFFAGSRVFLLRIWCLPNLIFEGYCGENRPRGDADYIPASVAKIKNTWIYNSTPALHPHGVCRNYFAFILAVRTVSRFTVVGPNVYLKVICFAGSVNTTPSASHHKTNSICISVLFLYCTVHDEAGSRVRDLCAA
jgi:hypothetical protein